MQFVDITNDIAFRKIFGNEQKTAPLISFLNALAVKWTYFIKHAEELHLIPAFANEDEGLKTAFMEADKYRWTKEELIAYDNVTIKEQDERGEKELIAQQAEKKGKTEVAKNLKTMGFSTTDIKKATGLSDEDIDKLG